MVGYYTRITITYKDKEIIESFRPALYLDEKMPKDIIKTLDWDDLEKLGYCSYTIWHWRKKRILQSFDDKRETLAKEWETPHIEAIYTKEFIPTKPSISDILNYPDIDKAVRFLREYGIELNLK